MKFPKVISIYFLIISQLVVSQSFADETKVDDGEISLLESPQDTKKSHKPVIRIPLRQRAARVRPTLEDATRSRPSYFDQIDSVQFDSAKVEQIFEKLDVDLQEFDSEFLEESRKFFEDVKAFRLRLVDAQLRAENGKTPIPEELMLLELQELIALMDKTLSEADEAVLESDSEESGEPVSSAAIPELHDEANEIERRALSAASIEQTEELIIALTGLTLAHGKRSLDRKSASLTPEGVHKLIAKEDLQTETDPTFSQLVGSAKKTYHSYDEEQIVNGRTVKVQKKKALWRVFLPLFNLAVIVIEDNEVPVSARGVISHAAKQQVEEGREVAILHLNTTNPELSRLEVQPNPKLMDAVASTREESLQRLAKWARKHWYAIFVPPDFGGKGVRGKVKRFLEASFFPIFPAIMYAVVNGIDSNASRLEVLLVSAYFYGFGVAVDYNYHTYRNIQYATPSRFMKFLRTSATSSFFSSGLLLIKYLAGVEGSFEGDEALYLWFVNTFVPMLVKDEIMVPNFVLKKNSEFEEEVVSFPGKNGLLQFPAEKFDAQSRQSFWRMAPKVWLFSDYGKWVFWVMTLYPSMRNPFWLHAKKQKIRNNDKLTDMQKKRRIRRIVEIENERGISEQLVEKLLLKDRKFLAFLASPTVFLYMIRDYYRGVSESLQVVKSHIKPGDTSGVRVCELAFSSDTAKSNMGHYLKHP